MRTLTSSAPFLLEGEKTILSRPVFLYCGCAQATARWATVQPQLKKRYQQIRPANLQLAKNWLTDNGLYDKYPMLKQHIFGAVVAPDMTVVDIMSGATPDIIDRIDSIGDRYDW